MKFKCYILSSLAVVYSLMLRCEGQDQNPIRTLDSLNKNIVGLILKANGKRYYVSSELCPGGVFLTRPVNENCLCYNGIFQIVRECCIPKSTRIRSDNLEWREEFKCGSSSNVRNSTKPIRAILPLAKPNNRFGSMIVTRYLYGNSTKKWRKFDTEDIIGHNNAEIDMGGKTQFEIVNIKPLGMEIKITFFTNMTVCYSGWQTGVNHHQNLRVRVSKPGATLDCCFNVTRNNIPENIGTSCSSGLIIAETIDVESVDIDIDQCDQEIPDDSPYTINNRKSTFDYKVHKTAEDGALNYVESNDLVGETGSLLFKRETKNEDTAKALSPIEGSNEMQIMDEVIIPRRKGLSKASLQDQALAINEFIAILRNDLSVEVRDPLTPRFQMLKKSFEIFLSVIPNEVVPNTLMTTAFDVFFFLFEELEPILYAPSEMFNKTLHSLDKCREKENMLKFTTTGCPKQIDELILDSNTKINLESYYKDQPGELEQVLKTLKHVEIRKDKRFIAELHDVYVELNWKVVDFVHSLCFEYFGKDFNTHTYYETEMETLFLHNDVQKRWYTERANLRYVRGIFPVADLKMSIKQLDKVVAIAHHISRYNGSYWLERPQLPTEYNPPFKHGEASGSNNSSASSKDDTTTALIDLEEKQLETRSVNKIFPIKRTLGYTLRFQEKLPPGELIWDGMAVCLHADYSNSKNYFVHSGTWGVKPSLFELGQLYV